jgi:hypothetical protein
MKNKVTIVMKNKVTISNAFLQSGLSSECIQSLIKEAERTSYFCWGHGNPYGHQCGLKHEWNKALVENLKIENSNSFDYDLLFSVSKERIDLELKEFMLSETDKRCLIMDFEYFKDEDLKKEIAEYIKKEIMNKLDCQFSFELWKIAHAASCLGCEGRQLNRFVLMLKQ